MQTLISRLSSSIKRWVFFSTSYISLLLSPNINHTKYLSCTSLFELGYETYAVATNKRAHEFLNKDGETHFIIPINMVTIVEGNKKAFCDKIIYTTFAK